MEPKRFWKLLALTGLLTLVMLWVLQVTLPASAALSTFTITTLGVFTVIVAFAYLRGVQAATSQSKYHFVRLTVMLIFLKMFIAFALIVWYVKVVQPVDKSFIIPFLAIYLAFTILEVYVLERVARMKPKSDHDE